MTTYHDRRSLLCAAGTLIAGAGLAAGLAGCAASALHPAGAGGAAVAPPPDETLAALGLDQHEFAAGVRLLDLYPSVDMHAHPGHFFTADDPHPGPVSTGLGPAFGDRAVADMIAGKVSATLFSAVADQRLLSFDPSKGLYPVRDFAPGEAYEDYRRQIGLLRDLAQANALPVAWTGKDVERARRKGRTAAIFTVEGGDFIEDRLDRVAQARADGVRAITIVHYRNNQIGDIQTAPRESGGGITPLGRSIVARMEAEGIVVDLAHASPQLVADVTAIARRPLIASHTNLAAPDMPHPRLIDGDTARRIAATGGIVGSVPSGIGQADFGQWIDNIARLADVVGVDHVGIGTDMDANYKPVFDTYRLWPAIPAALLKRGMAPGEVGAIIGGNMMRLLGG